MIFVHVGMLLVELIIYNFVFSLLLYDLLNLWLCYFSYMTLNKCTLVTYIIFMGLFVYNITKLLDIGLGLKTILFLAQLGVYAYLGAYTTFLKTRVYL